VEYKTLGRSGLSVSVAGLGCNNFGMRLDEEASREVISAALDAGITLFDTARIYGGGRSEEFLGRALRGHLDEVVLATKFGRSAPGDPGGSRRHLVRSVETSLRLLEADHIDLLQLHYPDPATPIEETLAALTDLVRAGKVLYIGCSNFEGWRLADADWTARTRGFEPFVSVQNEWSLLSRGIEEEVTVAAGRFGLSVLPYFPLASGLLTGKVTRGSAPPAESRLAVSYFASVLTDANFDKLERLTGWAVEHGRSLTELALSWLASQPLVASVIAGATTPEQVKTNVAATRTDLTPAEVAEVAALVG